MATKNVSGSATGVPPSRRSRRSSLGEARRRRNGQARTVVSNAATDLPARMPCGCTLSTKRTAAGTLNAAEIAAHPRLTGMVMGTAQYLSPEQARGEVVDARSDLYSAGVLLYELLTGRPPFTGDSPVSIAYQHVSEMPLPPSQVDPGVSPEIDSVVLLALAKRTDDRYQTAADFRADVERAYLAGDLDLIYVCEQTERFKWGGRVTIGHVTKLSAAPPKASSHGQW